MKGTSIKISMGMRAADMRPLRGRSAVKVVLFSLQGGLPPGKGTGL